MNRRYAAIDLKSFYASVECVERGLDPLTAKLVVADETRTDKTICLAVSPTLKKLGISGRARLYEVLAKVPRDEFIIASPQMKKYMSVSKQIFRIYSRYISPEDIHVYSIDEVFIDLTSYLNTNNVSPHDLVMAMIRDVLKETGITATAGIGTNLYLAKIAMDIEAKHKLADRDGVRIAELNEETFRRNLWGHRPLTDFWRIGTGYNRRLSRMGIYTMGDLARFSLTGSDQLYKEFGVNAELLIDHAWGWEPVGISDIKKYTSKNHSICSGQVLSTPYRNREARVIVSEMADSLALDLFAKGLETDQIVLDIGYDVSNTVSYIGEISIDRYGRKVPRAAHGSINLPNFSSSATVIIAKSRELFDRIVNPDLTIRRMGITANHVEPAFTKKPLKQLDIFTNYEEEKKKSEKDMRRQRAILQIKERYGKNAILKGINYEQGATARERNRQVGGHRA